MSGSNQDAKLLATALAASAAGAIMAVAAMKLTSKEEGSRTRAPKTLSSNRNSFIFQDKEHALAKQASAVVFPYNHEEKMKRRIAERVAVEDDNLTPRTSVTVKVPATSANVGPGCEYLTTMRPMR